MQSLSVSAEANLLLAEEAKMGEKREEAGQGMSKHHQGTIFFSPYPPPDNSHLLPSPPRSASYSVGGRSSFFDGRQR